MQDDAFALGLNLVRERFDVRLARFQDQVSQPRPGLQKQGLQRIGSGGFERGLLEKRIRNGMLLKRAEGRFGSVFAAVALVGADFLDGNISA
jgi:hypothetical protein